jgi:enamine deaminase RidA (YjgF/YER057c/UK114 family)
MSADRRVINPWSWQDQFNFVQANEVSNVQRQLILAGQTSIDEEGNAVHAGDMRAQINQSLTNLETVLENAGFELSDVVRLNYYTTDVEGFFEAFWGGDEPLVTRLAEAGCRPASTLLGVARLAFPELLVEIEATAVA